MSNSPPVPHPGLSMRLRGWLIAAFAFGLLVAVNVVCVIWIRSDSERRIASVVHLQQQAEKEAEENLTRANQEMAAANAQKQIVEQLRAQAKDEKKQALHDLEGVRQRSEVAENARAQAEAATKEVAAARDKIQSEANHAKADLAEKATRVQALEAQLAQLTQKAADAVPVPAAGDKAKPDGDQMKADLGKAQAQLMQDKADLAKLQGDLDSALRRQHDAESQAGTYKQQVEALTAQVQQLQAQLTAPAQRTGGSKRHP